MFVLKSRQDMYLQNVKGIITSNKAKALKFGDKNHAMKVYQFYIKDFPNTMLRVARF